MQSKTMGWRVVNQHDVVPQLPPGKGKLLFDFHHAPREVWCGRAAAGETSRDV
jgi:hypothetical protein